MKGLAVVLMSPVVLAACASVDGAGAHLSRAVSALAPAQSSPQNQLLVANAPEVAINPFAAEEVCQLGFVTGSRIRRMTCQLVPSPAAQATQEAQTDFEIAFAREQRFLIEQLEIEAPAQSRVPAAPAAM